MEGIEYFKTKKVGKKELNEALDYAKSINNETLMRKVQKSKMILARLKWNTPLYKVDEFVTKFRDRYKNKQVRIDVKLTDTECLIYLFKKFN